MEQSKTEDGITRAYAVLRACMAAGKSGEPVPTGGDFDLVGIAQCEVWHFQGKQNAKRGPGRPRNEATIRTGQ